MNREVARYVAQDAVQTERGLQNVHYRNLAMGSLLRDKDPRFYWLVDAQKMEAGDSRAWKKSILSELGRILDEEDRKAIALRVCELKPKTKEAVAMIRRWRTGKAPAGDPLALRGILIQTVNDYLAAHPETTLEQVREALTAARAAVDATEWEQAGG